MKEHPETVRQITSFVFLSCFLRHFCDSDREWLTQPLKRPDPLDRDFNTTFESSWGSSETELSPVFLLSQLPNSYSGSTTVLELSN